MMDIIFEQLNLIREQRRLLLDAFVAINKMKKSIKAKDKVIVSFVRSLLIVKDSILDGIDPVLIADIIDEALGDIDDLC